MNLSIVTELSPWFIPLCILFSLLITSILYYKDKKNSELKPLQLRLLLILRFISVFLITFLLLSPLIKTISNSEQKPIIIFAQDNSESILINKDSTFYKKDYKQKYENLIKKVSEKYEIAEYQFGENIENSSKTNFSEHQTNIAKLISEIEIKYTNRNVGALVLASDGIYNKGINPVYAAENLAFPIYSIALGDTSAQKDIIVSDLRTNKIAFLGNKFPMRVRIDIRELTDAKTTLKVIHNKTTEFSKEITAKNKNYSETIDIELEAKDKGIQHYTISVSPVEDEISVRNNTRDIVVDVVDSKQKILILANSPHPDVSAIREALETNPNFEVSTFTADKLTKNIRDFNVVILHQLPTISNAATSILSEIYKNNLPVLYILGSQSNITNFNSLKTGINITQSKRNFEDAQAAINKQFTLFEITPQIEELLIDIPPMVVPFGQFKSSANTESLLYQKVKGITTQMPLISIANGSGENENKNAVVLGEGLWRWRMYDFQQHTNHDAFDELINKLVQYLSLQVKKEHFGVNAKRIFNENEMINFTAEVYNESFEAVENAEITMEIISPEKAKYSFTFVPDQSKTKNYFVNAGSFKTGDYTYKATAKFGLKTYIQEGKFTVLPVDLESLNTIANHNLMFQLANSKNGKMYLPQNMEKILQELENNKEIVAITYSDKLLDDFINLKGLLFLLLILMSTEWFLRKFWGNY